MSYSAQKISVSLTNEIKRALHRVDYGSIEIYVQNKVVTQITIRNIKKTSYHLIKIPRGNGGGEIREKESQQLARKNTHTKIEVLTIKK